MNNSTPKRILVALATGLLLSACTGGTTEIPKTIETPMLTDVSQLKSPMAPYYETREEKTLIWKARRRYEEQCIQRFGVTLPLDEIDQRALESLLIDLEGRYPAFTKEQVNARFDTDTSEYDESDDKSVPLKPGEELRDEAITGEAADGSKSTLKDSQGNPLPEGGCIKEAWDRVQEDIPYDYDQILGDLMSQALNLTEEDPRYIEAEKEWSACMRKLGYEFEHHYDAGNSVAGKDVAIQREVELKSLGCIKEVNLAGRMMAIDLEYQYKLIKENEAKLRDVLDNKNKLLNNAKKAFK